MEKIFIGDLEKFNSEFALEIVDMTILRDLDVNIEILFYSKTDLKI